MLRKAAAAFVIISAVSTLVSAEISFDTSNKNTLRQEIAALELSAPEAAPAAPAAENAAPKEWTVMVFVNGKNNLERFAMLDMNEMEMVGSSPQVNIVAEVGRMAGYDASDGNWVGSRRYLVQKDNNTASITSPVVQNLGKVNMGDYNHLIDFANWAKAGYPAKKYMLIVWNHGSGWTKARAANPDKGISYDDETGSHISTPQLGLALKGIGGVNVYGSDACLMQMPEVDYEIKDYAEYIVGSEETEPGDGYTYNTFLAPLIAKPAMTPEELGRVAVDAYSDHYQSPTTQSLVKSAALPGYLAAVNDFAAAAMAANEKPLVKSAVSGAQSFAVYENKDLWHFLSLYAASSKDASVKAKAQALQDYLLMSVVVHNRGDGMPNAKGLAVYMPGYSFNAQYNNLAWAAASQWDEFVNWYLK